MGSCQAWSVYLTTRLLGRLSPLKRLTNIVHILSPETDNCPWISGRERMTVENISRSISRKECCQPPQGLNPRPPVSSRRRIQLSHRGWHVHPMNSKQPVQSDHSLLCRHKDKLHPGLSNLCPVKILINEDVQADLSLCWAHTEVGFLTLQLKNCSKLFFFKKYVSYVSK